MEETEHRKYMKMALEEARLAFDRGDGPIGCVIVHNEQVISRGGNMVRTSGCKLDHAEMVTIRDSAGYLEMYGEQCILYTTLEPCTMCLGAIAAMRIGRVVFGEADSVHGGTEAHVHVSYVRTHVKSYRGGVLASDCATLRSQWRGL